MQNSPDERETTQSGASSMSKQVKKRMTLSSAVRKFKSKIGTPSGAATTSGGPKRQDMNIAIDMILRFPLATTELLAP